MVRVMAAGDVPVLYDLFLVVSVDMTAHWIERATVEMRDLRCGLTMAERGVVL